MTRSSVDPSAGLCMELDILELKIMERWRRRGERWFWAVADSWGSGCQARCVGWKSVIPGFVLNLSVYWTLFPSERAERMETADFPALCSYLPYFISCLHIYFFPKVNIYKTEKLEVSLHGSFPIQFNYLFWATTCYCRIRVFCLPKNINLSPCRYSGFKKQVQREIRWVHAGVCYAPSLLSPLPQCS